jgi:hypothetical protein
MQWYYCTEAKLVPPLEIRVLVKKSKIRLVLVANAETLACGYHQSIFCWQAINRLSYETIILDEH